INKRTSSLCFKLFLICNGTFTVLSPLFPLPPPPLFLFFFLFLSFLSPPPPPFSPLFSFSPSPLSFLFFPPSSLFFLS
ncbi:hypothetical protein ACXWRW_11910, partial [Streptococcus pyogenes]